METCSMNPAFDRSDLLAIINSSLDSLESKHPKDCSSVRIIRKAVEQLAAGTREVATKPKSPPNQKREKPTANDDDGKLGDLIATAANDLFTSDVHEHVPVSAILPQMRKAVPELPAGDHAAKVAITRAFLDRKMQFKSLPGEKKRDPMRWHVKR
jgi:hypothetical protein